MIRRSSHPLLLLTIGLLLCLPAGPATGQGTGMAQGRQGTIQEYSVATLAPPTVVVPPIVLDNPVLHALLVELGGGASLVRIRERLGLDRADFESLLRLVAVENLGRQLGDGRWRPLALALDAAGVRRLQETVAPLAVTIADTLTARWAVLDSSIAALPVVGRLPLNRTGWVVLGAYLLGLFQHEAFWDAGLGPAHRDYAFRVYRVEPDLAPPGSRLSRLDLTGFQLIRYAPTSERYGFDALRDDRSHLYAALFGPPTPGGMEGDRSGETGEAEELARYLVRAYRLWYLTGTPPELPIRILLRSVEAVDAAGYLRVPIIAEGEIRSLRALAIETGAALWPHLMDILPAISETATSLGYGEDDLLGEVTLAAWELAVHTALDLLVEHGIITAPIADRGQLLLTIPTSPSRAR